MTASGRTIAVVRNDKDEVSALCLERGSNRVAWRTKLAKSVWPRSFASSYLSSTNRLTADYAALSGPGALEQPGGIAVIVVPDWYAVLVVDSGEVLGDVVATGEQPTTAEPLLTTSGLLGLVSCYQAGREGDGLT